MNVNKTGFLGRLVASAALLIGAPGVLAAESDEGESAKVIEEVVVTAQRRESNLQDTPIAMSVLGESAIDRLGANDFVDFVGSVPGLSLRDNGPGQTRPVIRGIFGPGEPQVGVYFDETPVTGAPGTQNNAGRFSPEMKPFDIERIEVLKGPQGTLYGSGSMGGTIRFIFNKPDPSKFAAKINVQGHSFNEGDSGYQTNVMVNVPLIEDSLALRAVAYKREDGGFVDNVSLGINDINDVDTEGGRIALKWMPNDTFTATGTIYYQDQIVGGGFHINTDLGREDPSTAVIAQEPFDDETKIFNLTLNNTFKSFDATYSFSRYERDAVFRFTNDFAPGVPFPTLISNQPMSLETDTHEFRLTSIAGRRFDWTAGVFYEDRQSFTQTRVVEPDENGEEPIPIDFWFLREIDDFLEQLAFFGEVTWHVTDRLALTGGARYFDFDTGTSSTNIFGIFGTPISPIEPNATRGSDDGTIFKAHLAYDVTDNFLLYGQFAQGFRAGGANQNTSNLPIIETGVPESFDSDSVDNLEVGIRYSGFNNRLRTSFALYRMEWDDIQIGGNIPTGVISFLDNGDGADVTGLELEATADITPNLRVIAGFSYVKAELDGDAPLNLTGNFSRSGKDGDDIPNVPDVTFNASIEYSRSLPWSGLRGIFFANVRHTGESQSDFNPFLLDASTLEPTTNRNIEFNKQGDYTLVDLRVGVESQDNWSVFLFAKNVFDKRAITQISEGTFRQSPGFNFIEKPRQVGISFTKDF